MEHFYTIQGEGNHQGKAAYFIRLGGCDVGCVWCDVKDSWDASKHPVFSTEEIVTMAVLGSKKPTEVIAVITGGAHELKVVVFNKSDFEWAEQFAAQVNPSCKLYLQPEWDKAPYVTPLIIDYIKENPQWRISLQIHKYLNVP